MHHRARSPFFLFGFSSLGGALVALLLLTLALYGCITRPVSVAKDSEQRAYALYGEFVIFEEEASRLRGSVPAAVYVGVQRADAVAKPTADSLLQAVHDYDTISAQLRAGNSTQDKLTVATSNLQTWVTQAETDVENLVSAVKGAKP